MKYLEYGPVICTRGTQKGRIRYYDDEDEEKGKTVAIVYFGDPLMCSSYYLISMGCLSNEITMQQLIQRKEELTGLVMNEKCEEKKAELLLELEYVNTLFYERHIQTHTGSAMGTKLFLSHSSMDKGFANTLYADLKKAGCDPWLDEWDIVGGQSIPAEIEKGIDTSDFLLILLSNHSVDSNWVRAEWESAIWDENKDRQTRVIPLLIEDCAIPRFLKYKKYIDFRKNYIQGVRDLLHTLDQLGKRRETEEP